MPQSNIPTATSPLPLAEGALGWRNALNGRFEETGVRRQPGGNGLAIIGIRLLEGENSSAPSLSGSSVLLSPEDTRIIHDLASRFPHVVLFFHRDRPS